MPLLQPIAGRAHYLPGSNNLGIVLTGDGGAIAIDTGLDKDTGRLLRKALDEARLTLRAIRLRRFWPRTRPRSPIRPSWCARRWPSRAS